MDEALAGGNAVEQAQPQEQSTVQVVAAWPDRVWSQQLAWEPGMTVSVALRRAGVEPAFGVSVDDYAGRTGVFGKLRALHDTVSAGERIELYRPLTIDPKEARRLRVEKRRRAAVAQGGRSSWVRR